MTNILLFYSIFRQNNDELLDKNVKLRYYVLIFGGNMYKYLFLVFTLFIFWGCNKPEASTGCSTDNPCEEGYVCESGKCQLDTPVTDCTANETKDCYTGGSSTRNVGACKDGVIICNEQGKWDYICKNEVKPVTEICGNGIDDNCNGHVDEDCGCTTIGETRDCYNGPENTAGKGVCKSGTEVCKENHEWSGECLGQVLPINDLCLNKDSDCNGSIDKQENRCNTQTECNSGDRRDCNTAGNNIGVGICKAGYNLCSSEGTWGTECIGEVVAQNNDTCGDGIDNNCNGTVDENCSCTPGEEKSCYTGNPDELGKGICESGVMICNQQGQWSDCQGESKPVAEACDGIDNNCNGIVDDGVANACGECGELPKETCNGLDDDCDGIIDNVLPENGGNACGGCGDVPSEICGNGIDDNCDNIIDNPEICDVTPECVKTSDTDICNNGLDDDCNGSVDDGDNCGNCSGTEECFTGSPNSVIGGTSICKKGTTTCVGGEYWGDCEGQILPQAEQCNGQDDDCDGVVDNGFNIGETCFVGVGECKVSGVYACNNQGGVTCVDTNGAPLAPLAPNQEICDGKDNNCNGRIDEIFNLNQNCYGGLGECQTRGKTICSSDHTDVVCDATPSQGTTELCGDGLDNDCNGLVDDVPSLGLACESGIGACKASGTYYCDNMNHTVKCNAIPGNPSSEICGDSIDNDCDTITDTDPELNLGNSCNVGLGICKRTGGYVCSNNSVVCDGTPGTADSRGEVCSNGLDDDCDGTVDETPCYSALAVTCPAPPMVRPVNPPDGYGRAFTLTDYNFTATVQGENGHATYKWELIEAPAGNQNIGGILNTNKSLTFKPLTISAKQDGSYDPYLLRFTANEGTVSDSCTVQFYGVSEDFIHVELTWSNASDMDLHVLVPSASSAAHSNWEVSGGSSSKDCGYNNCDDGNGLEWNGGNSEDNPHLDIDNIPGFGCTETNCDKPENINVPVPRSNNGDIYRVAVFGYDNGDNGSNLKIKINCLGANGLDVIKEYTKSELTSRWWWYMSDITWMGSYCVVTDANDIWGE